MFCMAIQYNNNNNHRHNIIYRNQFGLQLASLSWELEEKKNITPTRESSAILDDAILLDYNLKLRKNI